MGVTLSNQDGVLTAALTGDIDHHTARELRLAIDEAIERDKPVFCCWIFREWILWTALESAW